MESGTGCDAGEKSGLFTDTEQPGLSGGVCQMVYRYAGGSPLSGDSNFSSLRRNDNHMARFD
jgi:hypothetical protein